MPKIKLNGRELEVEAGKTVLQVALANGVYIPHFCYHPFLRISGNCRMCLVDIKPGPPKLSIACNTVVADNMEIDTENDKVKNARKAVMEFLLKNHPVDCPICDKAGECTLQDYYMKYDLEASRLGDPADKVKKQKRRRVGKNLVLDSERCILCTRCVRFMAEVVNDDCLVIKNRRDVAEITPFPGKQVDNPYSLNLTDICPVGAWTSSDFRFKQRVWFLESVPSICPGCARGCNTFLEKRRGEVYRMKPRVNEEINKCWLCDEGRLSYHCINDNRLTTPLITEANQKEATWDAALKKAAEIIKTAGIDLKVVVSASLSQEEGRAVVSLFKEKLGAKLFLHTGEPGWEDEFLRKADANANTKGLTDQGISEKVPDQLGGTVVVLEALSAKSLPAGMMPAVVIGPQVSEAVKTSKVALPAASYAETSGTFVNFEGKAQEFKQVLPPPGQALPYLQILSRLAAALGYKLAA